MSFFFIKFIFLFTCDLRSPEYSWGLQGRIQVFKLGGALKKIASSGGRRENLWGISCEKSRFYAKKSYFYQF